MDRRTLIGLTAGVGITTVTGCLGAVSDVTGSETEETEEPADRLVVGDGDAEDGTDVIVRNAGPEERTVGIELRRDGETALERTETLPSEDAFEITLLETGTYDLIVETDTGRSETSVTQPTDCADARTEIIVSEYGLETTTSSSC
ncbi:hypothetical protein C491_16632 [Natronococcus amylolyticus DSM 10524]|uniref:Ig-like domain-containing protein n=1 Tax=Natronococcus amylolyticus DSM 10524 TaxID=1227497 RepID=L9X0W0_9EURY|nr:hypothetical protein [Natronococcus amylolyticus]ELY55360.1 hypothetical protein C491_16632 [Natronococcus amylolyticus DSM 10524]